MQFLLSAAFTGSEILSVAQLSIQIKFAIRNNNFSTPRNIPQFSVLNIAAALLAYFSIKLPYQIGAFRCLYLTATVLKNNSSNKYIDSSNECVKERQIFDITEVFIRRTNGHISTTPFYLPLGLSKAMGNNTVRWRLYHQKPTSNSCRWNFQRRSFSYLYPVTAVKGKSTKHQIRVASFLGDKPTESVRENRHNAIELAKLSFISSRLEVKNNKQFSRAHSTSMKSLDLFRPKLIVHW